MKIDLINSEGPLLTVEKTPDIPYFCIRDQNNVILCSLTKHAFGLFLNGAIILHDSLGKSWEYPCVDKGMKLPAEKITEFILKVL